ncbi:peptidoglycan recognition protein family protein [Streptomyces himalayensis]|uniref:N-acetylmuramoyl-L-alanine amidase n=1 Tax=Streptomyces himalayensis subsp. himalayensis TaxID=2756131 RepID=A0A7W0ID60_9ACTN|nr:N-acetylmuramoyl-L-alanine amidase [Streptomyces himalayensis]MBA2951425.1 N-acetylmuramoyl-L-alanine amidase [Streptomyces himalayensis subsp. himalayensis]
MAPPMSPDTLLAVLKKEGCTVKEYGSWRTHNRNHKGAWGPINGTMTHHTATGPGVDVVALCYKGHSTLPGPLCQGVITKSGTVWLTSAGRANHAGLGDDDVLAAVKLESYGDYPPADNEANTDGNAHFYGFECENLGDGKDPWPAKQYIAMVKANAAILRHYGWTAKSAIAHKEWQPGKVDPRGIDMLKFRKDIAACLALPAGKWGGVVTAVKLTLEQRVAALEAAVKALRSQK